MIRFAIGILILAVGALIIIPQFTDWDPSSIDVTGTDGSQTQPTTDGIRGVADVIEGAEDRIHELQADPLGTISDVVDGALNGDGGDADSSRIMALGATSLSIYGHADNSATISYDDPLEQTASVSITLTDGAETLFTGQYFSSSFDTVIPDVADRQFMVEMTLDHSEYGIVTTLSGYVPDRS
jgi:hypothetical protein